MSFRSSFVLALYAPVAFVACHSAKPPAPSPAPAQAHASNSDSIEAAARARREAAAREQAHLDSIARAKDAAEQSARRAREAADAARATIGAVIHFDFDKDEILPPAATSLDAKVGVLQANRTLRLRIAGHTDNRGSDEYNLALGQRRAAAARRYLVARGVDEARLDVVSFGEERPVCRELNESCWAQNRRDEFSIIAGGETLAATHR